MAATRILGPIVAALLLIAACAGGSRQRGLGCACGGKPSSNAPAAPAASERSSDEAAPAPLPAPAAAQAGESSTVESSPVAELPDLDGPEWTRLESRAGTYQVVWRALEGEVPRNRDFTLEVWVLRDGRALGDGHLVVTGWMPAHGHGMLRRPRVERQENGSFRVEGMLLHMRGHWELFFEILEGTLSETAEFELDL